jgi:hypothetical protein
MGSSDLAHSTNFGYTSRMTADRLRRALFVLRTLPARVSFRLGRASFVACAVAGAEAELTPVLDAGGRPLGPRLLARVRLVAEPPRSGREGWALYAAALSDPAPVRVARLECPYCRHRFVFGLSEAPSAPDAPPAAPADFYGVWFRFPPSAFDGPAYLRCPRCETSGPPEVAHPREP